MKIFGSYHGHHDYVMVSIGVPYDELGDPRGATRRCRTARASRKVVSEMTIPVPFNDLAATERRIERLIEEGRAPACVIMEPAMMNLGVVLPEPGYLEGMRELTRKHGIVLIFDEVKTGLCIAAGGATERFGVTPDMVTLAKALGGGLPTGAIGAHRGGVRRRRLGTRGPGRRRYNGNPLAMAAARASLLEVLTPDAYAHLDVLNDHLLRGCQEVIERYNLPGYAIGIGSKGCVTFSPVKITDYESFKANQDVELTELSWLYNMNRGIFMTPGREEEWTLSVTHSTEDCDRVRRRLRRAGRRPHRASTSRAPTSRHVPRSQRATQSVRQRLPRTRERSLHGLVRDAVAAPALGAFGERRRQHATLGVDNRAARVAGADRPADQRDATAHRVAAVRVLGEEP